MNKFYSYVLIALIAIFFTSILFYGAYIAFPLEQNKCWDNPIIKDYNVNDDMAIKQADTEINKCNELYETTRKDIEKYKMILIGAINVILLIILTFFKFDNISWGLMLGAILSSIIATIAYYDSASIIGLVLVIIEFLEIIFLMKKRFA